ncbi:MAG: arsenate reductase ArsC [Anaerohalosphaeraceae bacterium]|nr:arsenate reductase ArsC [Anaerohalosphaeraceae bacterium]
MEEKKKLNVLFLCTGNSCRSQMAEGWATFLKSDSIEAFSAGTNPYKVNERAIKVMAEAGVDISKSISKSINDLAGIEFDYCITLCDHANESCPPLPDKTKHIHRPFADPSFMMGAPEVVLNEFRKARDLIRDFIETLPESLQQ